MKVPFNLSPDSVTVFLNGKMFLVSNTESCYEKIREMLKTGNYTVEELSALLDRPKQMENLTEGMVKVVGNQVTYNGKPVHDTLTIKLTEMIAEGFDARPWARFLDNLMNNPSYKSREQLFNFLEKYKTPITEDGHFLAFKRVRSDYRDIHSGKFDNSPGQVVSMPREEVDDDSNRTCSAGLHACASNYLGNFYSRSLDHRVVVVKINPMNVVSIPRDYEFSKMRVCEYLVLDDAEESLVDELNSVHYTDWDQQFQTDDLEDDLEDEDPMTMDDFDDFSDFGDVDDYDDAVDYAVEIPVHRPPEPGGLDTKTSTMNNLENNGYNNTADNSIGEREMAWNWWDDLSDDERLRIGFKRTQEEANLWWFSLSDFVRIRIWKSYPDALSP